MDRDNQPMNEDAKSALRQCLPILYKVMQTAELIVWMGSKNIFTDVDIQNIETKLTQSEKNKEFITLLKAKDQKAFDIFIECLWETGQRHLASQVLDKLMDRVYANELLRSCKAQRQPEDSTQALDIQKFA